MAKNGAAAIIARITNNLNVITKALGDVNYIIDRMKKMVKENADDLGAEDKTDDLAEAEQQGQS